MLPFQWSFCRKHHAKAGLHIQELFEKPHRTPLWDVLIRIRPFYPSELCQVWGGLGLTALRTSAFCLQLYEQRTRLLEEKSAAEEKGFFSQNWWVIGKTRNIWVFDGVLCDFSGANLRSRIFFYWPTHHDHSASLYMIQTEDMWMHPVSLVSGVCQQVKVWVATLASPVDGGDTPNKKIVVSSLSLNGICKGITTIFDVLVILIR